MRIIPKTDKMANNFMVLLSVLYYFNCRFEYIDDFIELLGWFYSWLNMFVWIIFVYACKKHMFLAKYVSPIYNTN